MCNSNVKSAGVAQIDGRPVLQPAGNRVAAPDAARPLKKSLHKSFSMPPSYDNNATVPARPAPAENTRAAAAPAAASLLPPTTPAPAPAAARATKAAGAVPAEKPRSKARKPGAVLPVATFAAPEAFEPAGSIAAARREHAAQAQAQRKSRIAHYGRTASFSRVEGRVGATATAEPAVPASPTTGLDEKRCSFITPYSDPLYVAYHDEEWGVPVHDDELLFEMLTLSGVQVGADWTSILKKRHVYREAFSGFDVDAVAKYTEKQMASLSADYGLDLGTVRGTVNNACRILEVRRDFCSLDKYVWAFVNNKPLSPSYKYSRKIPVKTSKSESISKDMVRRGFRFVGPTVIHSFMEAVGLTNDHLVSCPRHRVCSAAARVNN
ncbi:putative GMP synthase [glutamine-hydrolyzing] [Zea mays]|uniref:Putative GMP synthase [glutamine-hydrolyzing] n=1 Tax=Zea mays TaxID=4577 RepID=A0A3L6FN12_MAIZE|nr:putative GMP synthase [glutamine-hydrolyzing] [Zea mays]